MNESDSDVESYTNLIHHDVKSTKLSIQAFPENGLLSPGYLYDISHIRIANVSNYLCVYINYNNQQIFIPRLLSFPNYVNHFNEFRYTMNNTEYDAISYSILYPGTNRYTNDVIFIRFPIKDIFVWLLIQDIDTNIISFPMEDPKSGTQYIYGWFENTFYGAINKSQNTGTGKRYLSLMQPKKSGQIYPGSLCETIYFMPLKISNSPVIPAILRKPENNKNKLSPVPSRSENESTETKADVGNESEIKGKQHRRNSKSDNKYRYDKDSEERMEQRTKNVTFDTS